MNTRETILEQVRSTIPSSMPKGSKLSLFGSRARGDAKEESDWDFLLLLDKPQIEETDYERYVYPMLDMGWDLGEFFSVKVYTTEEWQRRKGTPFYNNVEREQILL